MCYASSTTMWCVLSRLLPDAYTHTPNDPLYSFSPPLHPFSLLSNVLGSGADAAHGKESRGELEPQLPPPPPPPTLQPQKSPFPLSHRIVRIPPQNEYLQLGCSKDAERRMLAFAKAQVGKPFSTMGMVRSVICPRRSDQKEYFCAELVATCLQKGGLLSNACNPAAATPKSLHALYKGQAATCANLYTLRNELEGFRMPLQHKKALTSSGYSSLTSFPNSGERMNMHSRMAPLHARAADVDEPTLKLLNGGNRIDVGGRTCEITLNSITFKGSRRAFQ